MNFGINHQLNILINKASVDLIMSIKHRKDCETALLARKGFNKSQPLLSVSNCTSFLHCVQRSALCALAALSALSVWSAWSALSELAVMSAFSSMSTLSALYVLSALSALSALSVGPTPQY